MIEYEPSHEVNLHEMDITHRDLIRARNRYRRKAILYRTWQDRLDKSKMAVTDPFARIIHKCCDLTLDWRAEVNENLAQTHQIELDYFAEEMSMELAPEIAAAAEWIVTSASN